MDTHITHTYTRLYVCNHCVNCGTKMAQRCIQNPRDSCPTAPLSFIAAGIRIDWFRSTRFISTSYYVRFTAELEILGRPSSGVDRSVFSDPGVALASRSSSSGLGPRFDAVVEPGALPRGERLAEPAGLCGAVSWPGADRPPATPPDDGNDGENIFDIPDNELILASPDDTLAFPVSTFKHLLGGANADGPSGLNAPNGKRGSRG